MSDNWKTSDRLLIGLMGGLSAILAAGLWALWIHFAILCMRPEEGTVDIKVWMTWVFSFEFFFTRIAWAAFRRIHDAQPSLMPLREWHRLSAILFAVGVIGCIWIHWAAAMVPWTLSCLCLFLDSRVQRFLGQFHGAPLSGPANKAG